MRRYRSGPNRRGVIAGATALAGVALLGWAVIRPQEGAAVPGWTPVNEQVSQALDLKGETKPSSGPSDVSASAADASASAEAAPESSPTASAALEAPAASVPTAAPQPQASASSAPEAAADGRLNLNSATAEQLDELKGIGPSKAQAIVAYREEHGAYRSVEELLQVNGIGSKVFASIRNFVKV